MLRPYQKAALEAVGTRYGAGVRRLLLAMATGTGKTVIFSSLPKELGRTGRVLVLVHREELAKQAAKHLQKWNPEALVGVEMADSYASDNDTIVVASVQTLGRANSTRIARFKPDDFPTIICDEAHHSVSPSYKNIFNYFGVLNEVAQDKILVGVTATPNRGDGQPLAEVYDEIAYQYPILQAIKDGWLSDIKGIRIRSNVGLDNVNTRAGDFVQEQLSLAVNHPSRNNLIVENWIDKAHDRQTVVFTVDIKHAQDLAAAFRAAGVSADAIWGEDPDREAKLDAHKAGKLQVLTNCNVLTEGYDDWRIRCVVMARPTKSQLLFVQMAGRGTRLQEGVGNLLDAKAKGIPLEKEDCLLIDVADNTSRHSLVTLPSIFGLQANLDLKGKSVIAAIAAVEKTQAMFPNVDLTRIDDIDKLDTIAQQIDLFTVKFPPEVEQNSKFKWFKTADGSYRLNLPEDEKVTINQDLLGKWNVKGQVNGAQIQEAGLPDMNAAFHWAEQMIMAFGKGLLTLVKRESKWHGDPATSLQIRLLRRFGVPMDVCQRLSKGEASALIDSKYDKKLTGKFKPKRR